MVKFFLYGYNDLLDAEERAKLGFQINYTQKKPGAPFTAREIGGQLDAGRIYDPRLTIEGDFRASRNSDEPVGKATKYYAVDHNYKTMFEIYGFKKEVTAFVDHLVDGTIMEFLLSNGGKIFLEGRGQSYEGFNGKDVVRGSHYDDYIGGGNGNDTLKGRRGDDYIYGDGGRDILIGGGGYDSFSFFRESDSGVGNQKRDLIKDFERRVDVIEFGFDSNTSNIGEDQDFHFVGKSKFSELSGEIRLFFQSKGGKKSTIVEVDTDGDGHADVQIELSGRIHLAADDFSYI